MSTIVNMATELASFGLPVFPVISGRKEPALRNWQSRATTSPEEIQRLFRGGGNFNIGVLTGAVSGVFVLDVDCKGADGRVTLADLERRHGELPRTCTARTPSGGLHLWFAYPSDRGIGNRVNRAAGLDIRGCGGFVVAPPSALGSGVYRWVHAPSDVAIAESPAWLLDLAAPPPPPIFKRPPVRLPDAASGRRARYAASALESEMRRVEFAPRGERNQTLFQAAANVGELVGAGLLGDDLACRGLFLAAEACGLSADDGARAVHATIASGLRRGMAKPREVSP